MLASLLLVTALTIPTSTMVLRTGERIAIAPPLRVDGAQVIFRSGGALYTTTVFARRTAAGKFIAVHTRHEFTDASVPGFTSRPEQYYGDYDVER